MMSREGVGFVTIAPLHVAGGKARWTCSAEKKKNKKKMSTIELTETEAAGWAEVRLQLSQLGGKLGKSGAADRAVMRAFGWKGSKYWRGAVERETPCTDVVEERLHYLRSLGFDDATLATMVAEFPELVRLPVRRLRENVELISKSYPILKGKALVASLASQPRALGYDVDCGGDCVSECSRCWVRFE